MASRRKGELSTATIDRTWPYQVALPDPLGAAFPEIVAYCQQRDASPRHHTYFDDGWRLAFCFGVRADAEEFKARFGGELIDPKTRPRWPGSKGR